MILANGLNDDKMVEVESYNKAVKVLGKVEGNYAALLMLREQAEVDHERMSKMALAAERLCAALQEQADVNRIRTNRIIMVVERLQRELTQRNNSLRTTRHYSGEWRRCVSMEYEAQTN